MKDAGFVRPEGRWTVRYLILTGDEQRPDLEQAMTGLRHRQSVCQVRSIRDELDADINELIDLWNVAVPQPRGAMS